MTTALIILASILGIVILWLFSFWYYIREKRKQLHILNKLVLSFPKQWKDLDSQQFLYVATLLSHNNTAAEIRAKCVIYFGKIKVLHEISEGVWQCKRGKENLRLDESTILYFSKCFNFITDRMTEVQLLPSICGQTPVHYQLRGVPFSLWMAAENYYQAFLFTQKKDFLKQLATTLYCADSFDDIAQFSDSTTIERTKKFKKVTDAELYTCFIAYGGLKNTLAKEFPYLFEKTNSSGSMERQNPPKMREMFDNMIYTLSEGGIHNSTELMTQECWKAFYFLDRKARENKEMQARLKKMGTK